LDVQFANPDLQRLYTLNAGAEKYTNETVKLFRRRIRHIEAAKDVTDLRCPSLVTYEQRTTTYPTKGALAIDAGWEIIISEEFRQKRIIVLELAKRRKRRG
jgi:plasmid maintenance system killer protein